MRVAKQQVKQICKRLNKDLIRFSFLARGNHNDNYLMEANGRKYVLRIENNPQFKNLKKEYNTLKALKPGLGPEVYFFDKSHKIIPVDYFVEEFIEGKYPVKKDEKSVVLMAKWLKKLHSQKRKCTRYSLLRAIKPYYRNFKNNRNALSDGIANDLDLLFNGVLAFCKRNDNIFSNRTTNSLLHRDLSRENIIYDGEKIRLLDWEFSNYNFQEWDLVYFMQSLRLNDKQKGLFLKTYGYPITKSGKKRLLIISLLNACGDVGYSVWRLGLVKHGKLSKKLGWGVLRRLKQDIKLLIKIIADLES